LKLDPHTRESHRLAKKYALIPLRLMVGYGFMQHGLSKPAKTKEVSTAPASVTMIRGMLTIRPVSSA
jgi:uncharacterized membrane protein YphA (DoxX/SURF4 family)